MAGPQSQPSTSPKETSGKESQESSASTDNKNENEERLLTLSPPKDKEKASTKRPGFLWTT